MICSVKLFAVAQQRVGQQEIQVPIDDAPTVEALKAAIAQQYPALADVLPHCMVAVNTDYAAPNDIVTESDEIAIIPPVSGG